MKSINQEQLLMERIISLQIQQQTELQDLKNQFHNSLQLLNPFSFLKSFLFKIDTVPDIKNVMVKGVVNLASNYLAKNPLFSTFQQPINNILRTVLNSISNKNN